MSKRKTVKLNLDDVKLRIKEVCRSYVVFSEMMGRPNQKTWVTGWGINKNLPSPEEAARMCAILQVTPEEILTEPADIELVRGLIDSQRSENEQKKAPTPEGGDGLSDLEYILQRLPHLTKEKQWQVLQAVQDELWRGYKGNDNGNT